MRNLPMTGIALITGAGTGIGKYSALALSAAGFKLVLTGRRLTPIEAVAAECETEAVAIPADVSAREEVDMLFSRTQETFGRLDVLFNNAGSAAPALPIDELTLEQWQEVVNSNLTGTFLCTQNAFRLMKTQKPKGGRIINNGSISAHVPRPYSSPYTATKHGVTGLTKSTSLDGRPHNIVCSQIDIGNALTEMTARMTDGVPQADGSVRPEATMDVAHVANAVVQIATMPLSANVQFMTIMASGMPFIGRG
ncbi:MAG: 3-oxoacyl-ACP reductase [Gammaproteobacteria bacterium]|nr:3-oxoacyl-ACP reductase [Gammaproteobacteria bacterium]